MKRLIVVAMHLLAVPVALVLAVGIALLLPPVVSERGVELALHDTYFVVAHFRASIVFGCCVVVATLVAWRSHSLNWALYAAAGCLVIHMAATLVAWHVSSDVLGAGPGTVTIVPPAYPGSAYLYLGSALAGLAATLVGLLVSLIRALQSPWSRPA
jgi:hypothetical protein